VFTQCPNCQKTQPLTVEQLRTSRAIVFCSDCSISFDALELLSDTVTVEVEKAESVFTTPLPWEIEPIPGNSYWQSGLMGVSLLLLAQLVYFEGYAFSQNPTFRPSLEWLCQTFNCPLPAYQNPDEFSILEGSLTALPNHTLAFRTIVSNQAGFAQPFPNLYLTLLDYTGRPFAYRIFQPQDYLPVVPTAPINADATLEIRLALAAPKTSIGGYTFELTY
jgi:hypothetical protein